MNLKDNGFIQIHESKSSKKYINNEGVIITIFKNGKVMKSFGSVNENGYLSTVANIFGNKSEYVHRLVAELFIGASDLEVDHIDGNRKNNNVDNLRWVSRQENLNSKIRKRNLSKSKKKRSYIVIDGKRIEKFSKKALMNYIKNQYGININTYFKYIPKCHKERISEIGYR